MLLKNTKIIQFLQRIAKAISIEDTFFRLSKMRRLKIVYKINTSLCIFAVLISVFYTYA